jgi:hypothetical protein
MGAEKNLITRTLGMMEMPGRSTVTNRVLFSFLGATALLALSAVPAWAMQEIGTIEATIGGESGAWVTIHMPSEDTATAEHSQFGPMTSISIQGHDPESGSMMRNVFSLEVTVMGEDEAGEVIDAVLNLFPEGLSGPFYTSGDAAVGSVATFNRLDLSGSGRAEGTFSGQLCRQDGMFSEIDLDDCRVIEGTFDTELHLADY